MSEMVERVGRALLEALLRTRDPDAYVDAVHGLDKVELDGTFDFREMARAAIEAMREPTAALRVPDDWRTR